MRSWIGARSSHQPAQSHSVGFASAVVVRKKTAPRGPFCLLPVAEGRGAREISRKTCGTRWGSLIALVVCRLAVRPSRPVEGFSIPVCSPPEDHGRTPVEGAPPGASGDQPGCAGSSPYNSRRQAEVQTRPLRSSTPCAAWCGRNSSVFWPEPACFPVAKADAIRGRDNHILIRRLARIRGSEAFRRPWDRRWDRPTGAGSYPGIAQPQIRLPQPE